MKQEQPATIRFFGILQREMKSRGFDSAMSLEVPAGGRAVSDLARELHLPAEMVEAVFINGVVGGMEDMVFPGDRLAFIPPGTPGPYRVLLGIRGRDAGGGGRGPGGGGRV